MTDNDAVVLQDLGNVVTMIDVKYRLAEPGDRVALKADRDAALQEYAAARAKLLADGIICGDAHIAEMRRIQLEIQQAAEREQLLRGIARVLGFMRGLA